MAMVTGYLGTTNANKICWCYHNCLSMPNASHIIGEFRILENYIQSCPVAFRQSLKVEAVKSWSISRSRNINMVRKILFVILSLQFLNAAVIANSTIITNGEVNYTAFKNSCIEKGSDGSVFQFWKPISLIWKINS